MLRRIRPRKGLCSASLVGLPRTAATLSALMVLGWRSKRETTKSVQRDFGVHWCGIGLGVGVGVGAGVSCVVCGAGRRQVVRSRLRLQPTEGENGTVAVIHRKSFPVVGT